MRRIAIPWGLRATVIRWLAETPERARPIYSARVRQAAYALRSRGLIVMHRKCLNHHQRVIHEAMLTAAGMRVAKLLPKWGPGDNPYEPTVRSIRGYVHIHEEVR